VKKLAININEDKEKCLKPKNSQNMNRKEIQPKPGNKMKQEQMLQPIKHQ
jgi:hypothetical protein